MKILLIQNKYSLKLTINSNWIQQVKECKPRNIVIKMCLENRQFGAVGFVNCLYAIASGSIPNGYTGI